ncbi:hypothetical protein [Nonomuraea endophytica]|uniref:Uncharacterized protein n=1 Tax=Nonomuraea endophytica TaxID=714136 RepID=A0A7W8A3F8_9ACTN|nr:hypothetical protein [Nonomuraea endophytica]MBB5078886.1 hypothetical protein [Nonomuraea endophytica]
MNETRPRASRALMIAGVLLGVLLLATAAILSRGALGGASLNAVGWPGSPGHPGDPGQKTARVEATPSSTPRPSRTHPAPATSQPHTRHATPVAGHPPTRTPMPARESRRPTLVAPSPANTGANSPADVTPIGPSAQTTAAPPPATLPPADHHPSATPTPSKTKPTKPKPTKTRTPGKKPGNQPHNR